MNSQFRTLLEHFFRRFFEVDSTSTDVDSRTRTIQLLAILSVPGMMLSFFLLSDHPSISMFGGGAVSEVERMWLRAGDRYVFVSYAMIAMGLLMTFKWDSLFPDRRDYLILTSLPISARRWFCAKVLALCAFLLLFVVAVNFFSLLLIPGLVATHSRVPSHMAYPYAFAGHAAATLGGSLFAALFFGALQGVLINVLTPQAFRRISPRVQMVSIAVLVTLLLIIPLFKDSLPQFAKNDSPLLAYFPVIWFFGLYEALLPGGSLMPQSIVWAYTALWATALVAGIFVLSYLIGYWRHSRKILESVEVDAQTLSWWRPMATRILDRLLLRHPVQRGTFHFIGSISNRSTRHRILTALYLGVGIALAISSLFVIDRNSTSAFPFRVSMWGALQGPLMLAFVLISGLRATFNVPYELHANWMFQTTGDGQSNHFLKAIRKWVFVQRIAPLFACIAICEFAFFTPLTAVSHLTFDLVVAAFLIEAFFFNFRKVPFTCAYPSNKIQLTVIAGAYLFGFTFYVAIAGGLKRVITAAPFRMAVFLSISAVVLALLERRRSKAAVVYGESEDPLLTLSADQGYWRSSPKPDSHARPVRVQPTKRRRSYARSLFIGALQDFRYGARILWKSPGLSATAVVLIALVIGLNTTVYSMVHALITRPAPGVRAQNLVVLDTPGDFEPFFAYPEYLEFQAETKTLHSLVGYGAEPMTFASSEGSYGLFGSFVTPNYFEGLDVEIVRGRGFTPADDLPGASALVAVISYRVWQEQFRGAADVIGRPVSVNNHPVTIIGVAAPLFLGADLGIPDDVWVPAVSYFTAHGRQRLLSERNDGGFGFMVNGRLKPGVSLTEAQSEFATISARLQAAYPVTNQNKVVRPMLYTATVNGGLSHAAPRFLAIFSVVTTMTLVIVCANVANLLLARAVVRQRETALRQSLGASRSRILRTLIAEGVAISAVAWTAAIAFAYWVSTNVPRLIVPPGSMNGLGMRPNHMNMDFAPDLRVLSYALLLALLGTVFFCVAPALRMWKQELLPGLKTGEQSVVRGRSRVSNALVVVQLAFSVVLLTSAGLAYRSLSLITSLDLGFNTDNLLLVTVNPTLSITNRAANLAYLEHIRERLVTVPGVQSVSYVRLPPPYSLFRGRVGALNQQRPIVANINYVGPDFLRVLGMAPVLGREFSATEGASSRKVAIINQNLALALWPNQSPIGQTVPIQGGKDSPVIIGITPNALFSDRDEPHFLFLAEQQDRNRLTGQAGLFQSGETTFYVRYAGNLDAIAPAIRGAMRDVDERVPVINMRTMQTQLDRGHEGARTLAAFLSVFSAGSLMIAAMGQYAVVAFEMRRRTREFGIRVAMGASARQIHSSILKEGLILTGIGLLIGFGLSITAGLAFRVSLAGVTPTDGRTYFGVFVLLAAASLLACYLPARRAARVDPLVALRYE